MGHRVWAAAAFGALAPEDPERKNITFPQAELREEAASLATERLDEEGFGRSVA